MTERTVRSMAKEFASIFYESNRTKGFRQTFPTFQAYIRGQWHNTDGSIKAYRPGWMHHVAQARRALALMLGKPDSVVSPHVKNAIFNALIEDRNREHKAHKRDIKDLPQAGMRQDG